jgi:hypothetical protein
MTSQNTTYLVGHRVMGFVGRNTTYVGVYKRTMLFYVDLNLMRHTPMDNNVREFEEAKSHVRSYFSRVLLCLIPSPH